MTSQSSLPIKNGTGSKPDISPGVNTNPDGRRAADAQSAEFQTYFQAHLNGDVIDVYERAKGNIAVPDQRSGIDRRRSAHLQQPSPTSVSLQTAENVAASYLYSTERKMNQSYTRTENVPPAIFSSSPERGKLIDIWA
jgi:hypothetical protein